MDTKDGAPRRSRQPTVALYRQARSGDQSAVNELYGRYLPRLLKWAEARVAPKERELVDTDALVRRVLLDTLQDPVPTSKQGGGFLGEARRAIDDSLTSELQGRRQSPGSVAMPDSYEQAFRRLDLRDQGLIAARLEEGLTYDEIALEEGLPTADEARKRVGEAILRLAERMRIGSRR